MRAAPAIMNGMYPIIRRKRRPLVEADVPPVVAGPVQPVVASPLVESEPELPPVAETTLVESGPSLADEPSSQALNVVELAPLKSRRAKSKRNAN